MGNHTTNPFSRLSETMLDSNRLSANMRNTVLQFYASVQQQSCNFHPHTTRLIINLMADKACGYTVCICIYLFIHKGTMHINEHEHVNTQDYSQG